MDVLYKVIITNDEDISIEFYIPIFLNSHLYAIIRRGGEIVADYKFANKLNSYEWSIFEGFKSRMDIDIQKHFDDSLLLFFERYRVDIYLHRKGRDYGKGDVIDEKKAPEFWPDDVPNPIGIYRPKYKLEGYTRENLPAEYEELLEKYF